MGRIHPFQVYCTVLSWFRGAMGCDGLQWGAMGDQGFFLTAGSVQRFSIFLDTWIAKFLNT